MKDKVKFNVTGDEEDIEVTEPAEGEIEQDIDLDNNMELNDEETPIESDEEEAFYVGGKYDELRDAMQDTDFRLILIGDDLVIPGTLDGNDIQFLDIVGDDENKEFVMKPAPNDINEVLDFNTLYNVENTEIEIPEDKEVKEAPHEEIVEYILNLKMDDKDTEDVEDDEQEIESIEREEEDEDESDEE